MTVVDSLLTALGNAVATDAGALDATRIDKSGILTATRPLAVVTPRTIADVQTVMRIATEHRAAVVTRGAGTGLAGGATASAGEIVLSTLALNRIIEVSTTDEVAIVQAGVINGDLNDHLAAHGYWFAPDPASRAISTIGGNIATNAGGLLCAKYGVTREAVLGLSVVLADGNLLNVGRRSVKGVTGLDLTALMIGSEGTLGVVVEATVRIRPRPRSTPATISAWFADTERALAACAAITAAGIVPAVMELLDPASIAAITALHAAANSGSIDVAPSAQVHVLVQVDSDTAHSDGDLVRAIVNDNGGTATVTDDPEEGERLLNVRRSFHPALERLGTVLIEDVCVPRTALPKMFREITRIENEYGISIPTVAHAGDGNLHPNFLIDTAPGPHNVPDVIWEAASELFRAGLRLGGTLTGEHGVGVLKKRWLAEELGQTSLDLQRSIKSVFDPHGILNPGKVF